MTRENQDKKILICVAETIPYNSGSGLSAYNFGKFLSENSHEVCILTLNRNLYQPKKSTYDKLTIRRIPYFKKNIFTKIFSLLIIVPSYFMQILKYDSVLIYGRYLLAYKTIILFSKILNKNVIFRSTLMNDDDISSIMNRTPSIFKKLNRKIFSSIHLYFSICLYNRLYTNI